MKKNNNILASILLSLLAVILFWLYSIKYPKLLFTDQYNYKNLSVYYNDTVNKLKLVDLLDKVDEKLKKSKLYNKKKRAIYLCNNKYLYTFLSPFNFKGLASNYVYKNNIFISQVDLKNNKVGSFFKDYSEFFDRLLAHEITHSLLNDANLHNIKLWINEGYCEYIAYDKRINYPKEINRYYKTKDKYIKFKIVVSYLVTKKKLNLKEIEHSDLNIETMFNKICQQYENY